MNSRRGEERGMGVPRTEEERRQRHESLYPGTPLPERGAGIGEEATAVSKKDLKIAAFTGLVFGIATLILITFQKSVRGS